MRTYVMIFTAAIAVSMVMNVVVADTSFVTSTGAVFIREEFGKFGLAWKAPDGTYWSSTQGAFANLGADAEMTVVGSDAVSACQRIGGRLPTGKDFALLRTYFESYTSQNPYASGVVFLTLKGRREFALLFPPVPNADADTIVYWSSTITSTGPQARAEGFNGYAGNRVRTLRGIRASVRCVGR